MRYRFLRGLAASSFYRCRSANAGELANRTGMLLEPTDQRCYICALFALISMDFIQHQELQHALVPEKGAVFEAGEQQL